MPEVIGKRIFSVPVLPVRDSVLFPSLLMPLVIGRGGGRAALEAALGSEEKMLGVFAQKTPFEETPRPSELFPIGTLAVIKKMVTIDHMLHVVVQGVRRIMLISVERDLPYVRFKVEELPELPPGDAESEALHRVMLDLAGRMVRYVQPEMQETLRFIISEVADPVRQSYLLATLLPLDMEKEIAVLSAPTQKALFEEVHHHLRHEVQVLELREHIASQAESEMGREHREYLLRKQMRAIQEELGEQTPELADAREFLRRLQETDLPEEVRRELEKELKRFERLAASSPEYQITRTHIELALDLPWNRLTEDVLDLDRAQHILDEDHFDLSDVKGRIVEHLAVMKLNPRANAPILCFVGPPGVGKTSVGQSIARAMGRKFERMSLGGLHDEAELRGHRRTYIGAMPGRIIQAIRRAGVKNPVLMLDEVDKLGRDFRGDPAAALMEVLDPAQNCAFHDNYLDLPFDLSKVFFITTANTLDNIPKPLLDRMEVLRLAGYSDEEKQEIGRRYLIPRQMEQGGLQDEQLSLPPQTLGYIIRRYTREAGVRELERTIGRIVRKAATKVARGEPGPGVVTSDMLPSLLGPEHFYAEQARKELQPGVAAGLAWTETGGEVLYVEAALLPEGKELLLTGQLGDVMQESAKAAQSYIWSRCQALGIDSDKIRKSGVHIHVPAGAVPKDGPSAGVTMVAALASLYKGVSVRGDTAMTGELTLSGLIMPVGGVKEKILAAHRAGFRRVVLPRENQKDLGDLPEHVRSEIEFVTVERIEELLAQVLPQSENV